MDRFELYVLQNILKLPDNIDVSEERKNTFVSIRELFDEQY